MGFLVLRSTASVFCPRAISQLVLARGCEMWISRKRWERLTQNVTRLQDDSNHLSTKLYALEHFLSLTYASSYNMPARYFQNKEDQ